MNTLSRVDAFLAAFLVPVSVSSKLGHVLTEQDDILHQTPHAQTQTHTQTLHLPTPTVPNVTTTRTRRHGHRRKPTASSIKLPPPSTPFFLRIALALWSILLSMWRSLVGEIRSERVQRRNRRKVRRVGVGLGSGRKSGLEGVSSDEGEGEGEGEGSGTEVEEAGVAGSGSGGQDIDWVDPVTRAPVDVGEAESEIDQAEDDEFEMGMTGGKGTGGKATQTGSGARGDKAEPDAITFRLRSAERRSRQSIGRDDKGNKDGTDTSIPASNTTSITTASSSSSDDDNHPTANSFQVNIKPPTPQKAFPPGILSNPLPRHSSSPPPTRTSTPPRSNRLLANPIQTSLLDPSVPLPLPSLPPSSTSTSSSPTSTPPIRPHYTPFHLQKTLILDLDETLIHSTSRPMPGASAGGGLLGLNLGALTGGKKRGREGHTVEVVLGGRSTTYHVYKRPYVDQFLKKVASWYTLVIYTASMPEYADPVIDWLDAGRSLFAKRLYRDSCFLQTNGSYIKDLALVERDLSRVCFMDNSPVSYAWNKANALPIEGWTHDPNDEALLQSLPVLDCLRFVNDVRRILGIRGFF